MANFPVPSGSDPSTIKGLYINEFTQSSVAHLSNPSPLWNLISDTTKWTLLSTYLNDNGYNYIILDNFNGKNSISGHLDPTDVLSFITQMKTDVSGLLVGAEVDLFWPDWNSGTLWTGGGDWLNIKSYNNSYATSSADSIDWVHVKNNFWDFNYSGGNPTSGNVTSGTIGTDYVRRAFGGSLGLAVGDFLKLAGSWYQVKTVSGTPWNEYQLTSTIAPLSVSGTPGRVITVSESKHTMPLNLYYSRLQELLYTSGNINQFNASAANKLALEVVLGGALDCATVNIAREVPVALYANSNYSRIIIQNHRIIPRYQDIGILLDSIYSGVSCSAASIYDLTPGVVTWADFTDAGPPAVQDRVSFGFSVSGESGTFNSSCNSAVDYLTASAGTNKATTEYNFQGYWFEGRTSGSGEYPLDGTLTPDTSIPFDPLCGNAGGIPPYTPPPVANSPKTINNAYDLVTQSGEIQVPAQSGTPLSLNDDGTTDLQTYIQFDTILIYDQERIRQLSLGGTPIVVSSTGYTMAGCFGECNGSINTQVSGGTSPYTFAWTGPGGYTSTSQNITGLCAGTYDLTVTDAVLATGTLQIIITEENEIIATLTPTDDYCEQCNGTITATDNEPSPGDYTYSWTGPGGFTSTSKNLTGLCSGVYNLVITNTVTGCTEQFSSTVTATSNCWLISPVGPGGSAVGPITCYGANDGFITVQYIACGVFPINPPRLTYSWTGPNGFTSTSPSLSGLAPGTYTLTITELLDSIGCTDTESFTITEPTQIQVTPYIQNPTCEGTAGIFITSITGGAPPYDLLWSTGATTQNITGIAPGTYFLTVTDSGGCAITEQYEVLTDTQQAIKEIKCCLVQLILKHLRKIRIGRTDECTLEDIKYIYLALRAFEGCYSEEGEDGDCEQIRDIVQKLKILCPCNNC